jgi:hypothetical protein
MPTTFDLSIINAAAGRTGNGTVTSLTTGGIVADIAKSSYEDSVKAALSEYPWKRASKTKLLTLLDADVMGDPPSPWTSAYQLPDDFIEIRTVKVGGYPIHYEVHADKILCDAESSDDVILHYIWRVPEADWKRSCCAASASATVRQRPAMRRPRNSLRSLATVMRSRSSPAILCRRRH